MHYGVVFPQTEIGADPAGVRRYAESAEALGYDYLLAFDHVIGANPEKPGPWQGGSYTVESMFHEPLVLFGYLAAITQRLEFATGILILPQRQTVLVAKQAAEVDVLSAGRLRLGIGVGWNPLEYEALGMAFETRGKRQAEQVRVLRKLWTQRLVEYAGEDHHIHDGGINPLPVQQPIPIWFGGMSDAVLRRMARIGDGWMPNTADPDALAEMLVALRGYLGAADRGGATFGIDVRIDMRRLAPETWPALLNRYAELGVTHVCLNTMGLGFDLDAHLEAAARFRTVVRESV
jgi:probable F420-dependent oxidoreductase